MTIKEWIKQKLIKFLGIQELVDNPNTELKTFINDEDAIQKDAIKGFKVWYIGDGNELLNYYTQTQIGADLKNPIYNRNKRNYFWELSATECNIKRIHSGVPHAIVDTLVNVIGMPQVKEKTGVWDKISDFNDFESKLLQYARPLTLVEGYGAWKININTSISEYPLLEFYDAENVEYIMKQGVLIGVIFKTFYKKNKKDYVLFESRYCKDNNSYIEYDLFELKKNNILAKCENDELGKFENLCISNYNKLLAVPNIYFYDINKQGYGRSIYSGKVDLFDMLDEILSQASQTNRVSTPVEYYSTEILGRDRNGGIGLPSIYNRQFVERVGTPNGEGMTNNDITTTQPDLNFDKYGGLAKDVLDYILTGILSPATMGIDVAKKDNAEAQREKEKVTIMTRNNVIQRETQVVKKLVTVCLDIMQYLGKSFISRVDYEVSVDYNEFANPSLESEIQVLGSAWSNGEISTERYVNLLWADRLSDEDKQREVEWLDKQREKDNMVYEDGLGENVFGTEPEEEDITRTEE